LQALQEDDPTYFRDKLLLFRRATMLDRTCQWILDDALFQEWRDQDSTDHPLIWISGETGTGKTQQALLITQHLEQTTPPACETKVLYYFCDPKFREQRDAAARILKGLVIQLWRMQQDLAKILYEEQRGQSSNLFHGRSIEPLWRVFQNMLSMCVGQRIYCIIDGVDHCHEEVLEHFLKKLNAHFVERKQKQGLQAGEHSPDSAPSHPSRCSNEVSSLPDLRMMIFSHENPTCILSELKGFPRRDLGFNRSEISMTDYQDYVAAKVEKVRSNFSKNQEKLGNEVIDIISKKLTSGEGQNYTWVDHAADDFEKTPLDQVSQLAQRMPTSLQSMHTQTLLDIPERQKTTVATILKWVAFALRPLSTLDLTKAVKYTLKIAFTKRDLKKALSYCGGIIRRDGKQVLLADQSIRHLMLTEQSTFKHDAKLNSFVLKKSTCHAEMANACVAYLQDSKHLNRSRRVRLDEKDKLESNDEAFFKKHPFLEYAIVHWTSHAQQGTVEETAYDAPFFMKDSSRRRQWWESYWMSHRKKYAWAWTAPRKFSLLHLAAFFDIVSLAVHVERQGNLTTLLRATDDHGMKPIHWATENSQTVMMKFLLRHGDFDEKALRQASYTGDLAAVTTLLSNRQVLRQKPTISRAESAPALLSNPFQSVRTTALRTVAEWSKRSNSNDGNNSSSSPLSPPEAFGPGKANSWSPLHIASACGHDDIVAVLLKFGEDSHVSTAGGWLALHHAAWYGIVPVMNHLIAVGVDAKALTKEKWSPLHCAVANDQPAAAKYLLDRHRVDLEAEDRFGVTPFHLACKAANITIMEILLDRNANFETTTYQGWTPLMSSCLKGDLNVVKLLLSRGAKPDSRQVRSTEAGKQIELSPLTIAKTYGREGCVHFLEIAGATDVNQLTAEDMKSLPPVLGSEILERDTHGDRQAMKLEPCSMKVEGPFGAAEESDGLSESEDEVSDEEDSDAGSSIHHGSSRDSTSACAAPDECVSDMRVPGDWTESQSVDQGNAVPSRKCQVLETGCTMEKESASDVSVPTCPNLQQVQLELRQTNNSNATCSTSEPPLVKGSPMFGLFDRPSKSPSMLAGTFGKMAPKRANTHTGTIPDRIHQSSVIAKDEHCQSAVQDEGGTDGEPTKTAAQSSKALSGFFNRLNFREGEKQSKQDAGHKS
jgi:ankyrin repeat protein